MYRKAGFRVFNAFSPSCRNNAVGLRFNPTEQEIRIHLLNGTELIFGAFVDRLPIEAVAHVYVVYDHNAQTARIYHGANESVPSIHLLPFFADRLDIHASLRMGLHVI